MVKNSAKKYIISKIVKQINRTITRKPAAIGGLEGFQAVQSTFL
jgi:hypothetical protein